MIILFKNNTTIERFNELGLFTSVTSIPQECFKDCTNLTEVVLPDTLTTIQLNAFDGCTSLQSILHIYVPDSAKAAYLADTDWASIGGWNGSDTIADRLHGLSELPAGVWTTGLAFLYLTAAQLATS